MAVLASKAEEDRKADEPRIAELNRRSQQAIGEQKWLDQKMLVQAQAEASRCAST
jgi:hypothetical protein